MATTTATVSTKAPAASTSATPAPAVSTPAATKSQPPYIPLPGVPAIAGPGKSGGPGGPGGPGNPGTPGGAGGFNWRTGNQGSGKEIQLNLPETFNRDPTTLDKFILDVKIYTKVNEHIYNNDLKKITFASLLLVGEAAAWKQLWFRHTKNQGIPVTLAMFFYNLTTDFSATTQKSEAIFELGRIRQGSKTVE